MDGMVTVAIVAASFLIGSVPTGYLVVSRMKGLDIRRVGSGNVGSTNVLRACGIWAARLTQAIDFAKGLLPVLAVRLFGDRLGVSGDAALWAGLAAILGHDFTPFLGFKGGKGVNTTVGAVTAIAPLSGLIAFLTHYIAARTTGYVSVASILVGLSIPVSHLLIRGYSDTILYFTVYGALLVAVHHSNVVRLVQGRETKRPKA